MHYGAGIRDVWYGKGSDYAGVGTGRAFAIGHPGDTYGFLSHSGFEPDLAGGFSFNLNIDAQIHAQTIGTCRLLETVKRVVAGDASVDFKCDDVKDTSTLLV